MTDVLRDEIDNLSHANQMMNLEIEEVREKNRVLLAELRWAHKITRDALMTSPALRQAYRDARDNALCDINKRFAIYQ